MSSTLPYWLAALYLPEMSPRKLMEWVGYFSGIEKLFTATFDDWHQAGLSQPQIEALQKPNWQAVEKDMLWATHSHHHIMTIDDENYPPLLKEISDPPFVLFVKGNKLILSRLQLAMVGSRRATMNGANLARQFAYTLAESGWVITSGLALGIDGASHQGALAAKGLTIAVAGTGLLHTYPRSHRKLADNIIAANGAIISEFPLDTQPKPYHFPRRNRIIGGLSIGVLVIEAALKSGSLITARHALEQGREVFAIPGSIHQPLARGCHYLIRQGATLVESTQDVLDQLTAWSAEIKSTISEKPVVKKEHALLQYIEFETTPADVLVLRSGLSLSEISSHLLTLELNGEIQSVPGGYIRMR